VFLAKTSPGSRRRGSAGGRGPPGRRRLGVPIHPKLCFVLPTRVATWLSLGVESLLGSSVLVKAPRAKCPKNIRKARRPRTSGCTCGAFRGARSLEVVGLSSATYGSGCVREAQCRARVGCSACDSETKVSWVGGARGRLGGWGPHGWRSAAMSRLEELRPIGWCIGPDSSRLGGWRPHQTWWRRCPEVSVGALLRREEWLRRAGARRVDLLTPGRCALFSRCSCSLCRVPYRADIWGGAVSRSWDTNASLVKWPSICYFCLCLSRGAAVGRYRLRSSRRPAAMPKVRAGVFGCAAGPFATHPAVASGVARFWGSRGRCRPHLSIARVVRGR